MMTVAKYCNCHRCGELCSRLGSRHDYARGLRLAAFEDTGIPGHVRPVCEECVFLVPEEAIAEDILKSFLTAKVA